MTPLQLEFCNTVRSGFEKLTRIVAPLRCMGERVVLRWRVRDRALPMRIGEGSEPGRDGAGRVPGAQGPRFSLCVSHEDWSFLIRL